MANQTSLKNTRQFKNDNPILSDLKPHMGNSWVRHKQLLESESADGFPILSEFWNLKCEILELGTCSYQNLKIFIATSEKNFQY